MRKEVGVGSVKACTEQSFYLVRNSFSLSDWKLSVIVRNNADYKANRSKRDEEDT